MKAKAVKQELKYPKGERVRVGYRSRDQDLKFILTEKADWFYLYEVVDGEFRKLGRAKEPPQLVEKYHVLEIIAEA